MTCIQGYSERFWMKDLQKSKVSLRELEVPQATAAFHVLSVASCCVALLFDEAMVKKTTTELKSGKGRMLEAEDLPNYTSVVTVSPCAAIRQGISS